MIISDHLMNRLFYYYLRKAIAILTEINKLLGLNFEQFRVMNLRPEAADSPRI